MLSERLSGILLHPTSLPGPFGIGDLGKSAYDFVDWLVAAKQQIWQVLPLGPTGYGDSPYQCFSAFAGNPLLIDLEDLVQRDHLTPENLAVPIFPRERVDYGPVINWKKEVLQIAYNRFQTLAHDKAFETFVTETGWWLQDYAIFMALKDAHRGRPWPDWEPALRDREPTAMQEVVAQHTDIIRFHYFQQWIFFEQWLALKAYANERRIQIVGDIPIYVALDSADAWSKRSLFHFDDSGSPIVVAGVPPDYFSPTGQLWGNPIYNWEHMAQSGFEWWISRIRANLQIYDSIRVDHFRGFYNYWQVPGDAETAVDGEWIDGPREAFFDKVISGLGELPLIAEDLGEREPGVYALRDHFNFPGMKVLQFAWSTTGQDPFLPQNYDKNCVVYTGTHDNDTTRGWFDKALEQERDYIRRYLRIDGDDIAWDLMRLAMMSSAAIAIVPLQDCMNLGSDARMNTPASASGNWTWRFSQEQLNVGIQAGLAEMCDLYGRSYIPPTDRVDSPHAK